MVTPLWSSEGFSVGERYVEEFPAPTPLVLEAQANEADSSNPATVIRDSARLYSAMNDETSALVGADDARRMATEANVRLDIPNEGIRQRALDMLIKSKREEMQRQSILARAQGGAAENAMRFGIGLGVSLLDPLNVASAFIPVVGEARWAEALAGAGSAVGRAGVRLGYGAVEGAAGAALVEPIVYGGKKYQQADYGLQDSLLNVVFGAALGGGLHMGAGAVGDAVSRGNEWWRTSPQGEIPQYVSQISTAEREELLRSALGQVAEGKRIEIDSLTPDFKEYININRQPFDPAGLEMRSGITSVLRAMDRSQNDLGIEVVDLGIRGEEIMAHTKRLDEIGRQQRPQLYADIDNAISRIDEATNKLTDQIPLTASRENNIKAAKARAAEVTTMLRKTDLAPSLRQRLEAERNVLRDLNNAAKDLEGLERQRERFAQQIQRQNPPNAPRQKYSIQQVQEASLRSDRPEAQMLFDQSILDAVAERQVQQAAPSRQSDADPTTEVDAETAELTADVKRLADNLGIELKDDFALSDEFVQKADSYVKMLESLADCGVRRG